jgi:acyl carrier protein
MAPSEPPPKTEILQQIQLMMKELFELPPERVQPDARLIEDLELDSLDAIDLAVKVEESTGLAFEESKIRQLRTIDDVIVALQGMIGLQGLSSLTPAAPQQDP